MGGWGGEVEIQAEPGQLLKRLGGMAPKTLAKVLETLQEMFAE